MEEKNESNRRDFLKIGATALVAAAVPTIAAAQKDEKEVSGNRSQPVYLYGCGWNRSLPGILGQACFTFDMRAEVGGTGVGTIRDDVYPEVNSQYQIHSATRRGKNYTFDGEIISSRSPDLVGMQVKIVAESLGDGKGRASITIGTEGENLVVIAIIAILIAMLLPAVQREPR